MTTKRAAAVLFTLLLGALLVAPAASAGENGQKPKLPENYKKWLDEEVVYIIAPIEREVFLKLQTDRERDLFIEAFWKQRDPTPGSAENEFKTEHFRRIAYADRYLGRDAPRPGWKTDRGRIYIILGEARDIQRFEGKSATYDAEVWFYQGKTDMGLPAGFNLVFFKEGGHGEYKLYSPVGDGPQALLAGYFGGPDYERAYAKLREVEPNLAAVSLSLVPGEGGELYGRPSMSSDLLIQRIESAAARNVEAKYAQKFLQYKDLVEVEYTANYLDCDSIFKVFRDPSGVYFVHYAVEPRRLSMNQYESKYTTTLKVNGRVTTAAGRLVHQFDKTVSLNLSADEMSEASRAPFDFQDLFPLIGGDYSLSVLIKNEASKEFSSVEQALRIPQGGTAVQMTQPLLGYKVVRLEPAERRMKAFRVGPFQVYCQPNRVFTRRETLIVLFQLNGLSDELAAGGEVRLEFLKDGQPFRNIRRKPSDYPELPNVLEQISLADFPPAHYTVRASVVNGGAEVVSSTEEFDLSFAESVPRPWFSSRVLPNPGDPVYDEILGAQLFNLGRIDEARVFLEKASQRDPESEDAAANLARAYLALQNPPAAVKTLAPFITPDKAAKYDTCLLAAEALKRTGEFGRAVELLDKAVAHYGVNAVLLNSIGECYAGLGKTKEALAAFEKSLELSPDQPEVRKKAETLKKKAPL
ncbi:MAG: GWxTD domain-containing protein [Candidatus Aminicenantes bacterium]|nr:GWxTD domain-containing protein [Candidatus Aminicenantes bacterium]